MLSAPPLFPKLGEERRQVMQMGTLVERLIGKCKSTWMILRIQACNYCKVVVAVIYRPRSQFPNR